MVFRINLTVFVKAPCYGEAVAECEKRLERKTFNDNLTVDIKVIGDINIAKTGET